MDYLRIEKAIGSTDIKIIETLAKEIWTQHFTPIIGEKQVSFMLDKFQSKHAIEHAIDSGYIYYIAYYNDIPCGYSAVRLDEDGLLLSKLYIKQVYRGKGIARTMLMKIDEYARNHDAKRIWLTCNKHNTASLNAYHKLGFIQIDEFVKDIGGGFVMDDYVLEKIVERI